MIQRRAIKRKGRNMSRGSESKVISQWGIEGARKKLSYKIKILCRGGLGVGFLKKNFIVFSEFLNRFLAEPTITSHFFIVPLEGKIQTQISFPNILSRRYCVSIKKTTPNQVSIPDVFFRRWGTYGSVGNFLGEAGGGIFNKGSNLSIIWYFENKKK